MPQRCYALKGVIRREDTLLRQDAIQMSFYRFEIVRQGSLLFEITSGLTGYFVLFQSVFSWA
jgi:hypothetical protein